MTNYRVRRSFRRPLDSPASPGVTSQVYWSGYSYVVYGIGTSAFAWVVTPVLRVRDPLLQTEGALDRVVWAI